MKHYVRICMVLTLLVSIVLSQTACYDRAMAVAMTDAGIQTADLLNTYYTNLASTQRTVYELTEFNRSLDKFAVFGFHKPQTLTESDQAAISHYQGIKCDSLHTEIVNRSGLTKYNTEVGNNEKKAAISRCSIDALEQRATMAKELSDYFQAFKKMADYKFSEEVTNATNKFVKSFSSLVPLPELQALAKSEIIGQIASDIADAKQKKDVSKQAKVAMNVLRLVKEMFDHELPTYKTVNEYLVQQSTKTAKFMLDGDMIQVWKLLDSVPNSLGLTVIPDQWTKSIPAKQITTQDSPEVKAEKEIFNERRKVFIDGFYNLLKARQSRIIGTLSDAGTTMSSALGKLEGTLNQYIAKNKNISTADIADALSRTAFYLAEFDKLKTELNRIEQEEN